MLRSILGTTGSRLLTSIMGFISMILNTRALGAEGFGIIGLITLAITIILLINSFVGGTAYVYWASRTNVFVILFQSYCWAFIVCCVFVLIINVLKLVPPEYDIHVVILSFIFSLASVNLNVILGKQMIRSYNIILICHSLAQLLSLYFFYKILKMNTVMAFVWSCYIAYTLIFILSLIALRDVIKFSGFKGWKTMLFSVVRFGAIIQFSSFVQMLNYRLSYYIINQYLGVGGVGIYHAPNQLAEGTWVIGKSVATVQYSTVSNTEDHDYARRYSLNLLKITSIVTLLLVSCMLAIPGRWYLFLGKDFVETRMVILCLSVGITANACSMMFSHYFAGIGKPQFNFFTALIGLVFTLGFGYWLIPEYGVLGAGITASISYSAALIYLMIAFFIYTDARPRDLWITRADIIMITTEIKKILKSRNKV